MWDVLAASTLGPGGPGKRQCPRPGAVFTAGGFQRQGVTSAPRMRGGGAFPRILGPLGIGWVCFGCGDVPLCQREVFIAFQQTVITADVDSVAPGVQTEIQVRSSLREGEIVVLDVLDPDGAELGRYAEPVDRDGNIAFAGVSVPTPRVTLRASGRGTCGEAHDEITIDVIASADCAVRLDPEPEHNAHFAPLGVLSTRSDPDPVTPGYQTTLRVQTRPGWTAEIIETTTSERSLAIVTTGSDGTA